MNIKNHLLVLLVAFIFGLYGSFANAEDKNANKANASKTIKQSNVSSSQAVKQKDNINEHIPVFVASDDGYAPYVATTMVSILKHTKSFIDYYVLDGGISEENQKKILKTAEKWNNVKVHFVKIDMSFGKDIKFAKGSHVTLSTYSRLFIPMLPETKNIKKAIYMDVDMIVIKDIKEIYDSNLEGNVIGAVKDLGIMYSKPDPLHGTYRMYKLDKSYSLYRKYFNAGLLLIDCEKWRQGDYTKKVFDNVYKYTKDVDETKSKSESKTFFLWDDQDGLNVTFKQYKELPTKFNANPDLKHRCIRENLFCEIQGKDKQDLTKKLDNYFNNDVVVLHYWGKNKPWNTIAKKYMYDEFCKVVPDTEFKNDIKFGRIIKALQKHFRNLKLSLMKKF